MIEQRNDELRPGYSPRGIDQLLIDFDIRLLMGRSVKGMAATHLFENMSDSLFLSISIFNWLYF